MLIENLIARLQQLQKEGIEEVRIATNMRLCKIDELTTVRNVVVLCNNEWMNR